jgi:serine/threonine protein kinase
MARKTVRIDAFDFQPGRRLAGKYAVESLLGSGWEGEVYKVVEIKTGIPRAAKVFFPQRNAQDRAVTFYAKKLNRLRECPIVIQYHNSESIRYRGVKLTCLISEYVEGELLTEFIASRPGKRMHPFEALHLLYSIASGLEHIHNLREYHGDIHSDNVFVMRRGVHFDVKMVDLFHWGSARPSQIREDVIQLIRLVYDAVGGAQRYAKQPAEIKAICCGLRRDLIARKFPTAGSLRRHLDSFQWHTD